MVSRSSSTVMTGPDVSLCQLLPSDKSGSTKVTGIAPHDCLECVDSWQEIRHNKGDETNLAHRSTLGSDTLD